MVDSWAGGDKIDGPPAQGRMWMSGLGRSVPGFPLPGVIRMVGCNKGGAQGPAVRGLHCPRRGIFLQAPGKDLLLLFEACLNAGSMMCSNSINKYNSSHGESLVFAVNSASKQRHHFVFCSLTPFIILLFNRSPLGLRDASYFRLFPIAAAPPKSRLPVKRIHTRLVGAKGAVRTHRVGSPAPYP